MWRILVTCSIQDILDFSTGGVSPRGHSIDNASLNAFYTFLRRPVVGEEGGTLGKSISIWEPAFHVGFDRVTNCTIGSELPSRPQPANCCNWHARKYNLEWGTASASLSLPYCKVYRLFLFFFRLKNKISKLVVSMLKPLIGYPHWKIMKNVQELWGPNHLYPTTERGCLHQLRHFACCLYSNWPMFNPR